MKRFLSVLLALCMTLALTACGGNQATSDDTQNSNTPSTADSKTLNLAFGENIWYIDPHAASNLPSYQIRNMCFEPLIETTEENGFRPCLATDWIISEDGLTWTFTLRKGVKFHNGEDFTSADVVATFERLLNCDGKLSIYNNFWKNLASVGAVDDYTVNITMKTPYATNAAKFAFSVTAIIPDEAYAELGEDLFMDDAMYGTGPWVFDEFVDGQYAHVIKNNDYWNKAEFDSYYEDVYLRITLEPSSAVASQLSGDVQAYLPSGGISSDILSLYDGHSDTINMISFLSGSIQYIGLNCNEGAAFEDLNTRLAFAYAIDRETIVKAIYGGGAAPDNCFMPEGTLGWSKDVAHYDYNPELAKDYLSKSTYDGRPITLTSSNGTLKAQECLLAISEYLTAVGFNVEKVDIVEGAVMNEMRATGDYDTFLVVSMQEHNEPYKYLNYRILNDTHHSGFVNEEMFDLIRASNSEMDETKRQAEIEQALVIFSENVVHYQVVQLQTTFAVNQGIEGIWLFTDGMFTVKYADHA